MMAKVRRRDASAETSDTTGDLDGRDSPNLGRYTVRRMEPGGSGHGTQLTPDPPALTLRTFDRINDLVVEAVVRLDEQRLGVPLYRQQRVDEPSILGPDRAQEPVVDRTVLDICRQPHQVTGREQLLDAGGRLRRATLPGLTVSCELGRVDVEQSDTHRSVGAGPGVGRNDDPHRVSVDDVIDDRWLSI